MNQTPQSPVTPQLPPAQNREKPGVEPGFTAIPNRTAEGLSAWPYSLSSLKLYIYLCRQSWGWRNKATKSCYCRPCIAQATNMHVSTVSKALTELEKAELVEFRTDGRIDLDLKGPEVFRAKVPRCPEHTSLKYAQQGTVAKRPRRRGESATGVWRNGHSKRVHTDVSSSVTSAEKKLLKKEKEIRTSPAPPGAFQNAEFGMRNEELGSGREDSPNSKQNTVIASPAAALSRGAKQPLFRTLPPTVSSTDPNQLSTRERQDPRIREVAARGPDEALSRQGSRNSRLIPRRNVHVDGKALAENHVSYASPDGKERSSEPQNHHDPRFREVAVAWIRKCPHEPERAGSVDSWTGRLIQIAERLNVSPHILIRCVPDDAASPRGYVRGFESGAYPLPAWTEDPAHKQTFYDWVGGCGPG